MGRRWLAPVLWCDRAIAMKAGGVEVNMGSRLHSVYDNGGVPVT
jgi:hypothetical protein